jgi:phage terminase large subunit
MLIDANFPAPLQCLFQPKRYKVLWGGRGAGRSWGVARALLLFGTEKPINVLCARELQKSIEESVHKTLSINIEKLGLQWFYQIQKQHIIGNNGTTFSFEGIKNNINKIRSYEGVDYCWVEEANNVSKNSWSVLTPTIRKIGSEIWMTFNPELDTDYTYVRFVKEADLERSFVVKMTYKDNPWFETDTELKDDMEYCKKTDYDEYLNVWEGFCKQVLEGAVYGRELRKVRAENRICAVPYDPEIPVNTFWDLGRANNTAIWFAQRVAMQYRILSYYFNG